MSFDKTGYQLCFLHSNNLLQQTTLKWAYAKRYFNKKSLYNFKGYAAKRLTKKLPELENATVRISRRCMCSRTSMSINNQIVNHIGQTKLLVIDCITDLQGGAAKVRPTYIFDGNI